MGGIELNLLVLLVVGFGFLFVRHRHRTTTRRALAARRGLGYALRGLEALPAVLQETVLFTVADGGHERDVVFGDLTIAGETVAFTSFEFTFQRDVRGEWGYLATEPPFRLSSPVTVLTYQLPGDFAHLLVKRRGRSERIGESSEDRFQSMASVAREATGIARTIAVEPPPALGLRPARSGPASHDYLIWAERPEQASRILPASTIDYLESSAAGDRELVIELLGPLLLVYCASAGALSAGDAVALSTFAEELCRRVLTVTSSL